MRGRRRSWRRLGVLAAWGAGFSTLAAAPWSADELQPLVEQRMAVVQDLFDQLDLQSPELAAVRHAAEAGEMAAALAELFEYYSDRPEPDESWLPPFTAKAIAVERADSVLEDEFRLQGIAGRQPRLADGGLDWEATGPRDDPEWAWMLNRHAYFEYLLLAYRETGDTRYIKRLSADLVDWVTANPYPDRLTFSAAWRPLEVARRILNSWTHIFFALGDEPAFSAEARLLLLSSLPKHADALADHYSFWGGNHLLTETTALATIAVAWPEFAASRTWLATAIERFHEELMAQTYSDGAFKELTNHYQKVVWLGAERFIALLAATERDDSAVENDLRKRLMAMRRYFEGVVRPDGKGPLNNAADLEDNIWHLENAGVARRFPTTGLENGESSPVLYFPWAGHAVMRDRWGQTREWAFFDMGPYGSAHQHRDALHLSVWFDDALFLADSGRFTYQPGPWSNYFTGPRAHNVVLLDGTAPLPGPRTIEEPLPNRRSITGEFAWFSGRTAFAPSGRNGTGPSFHERTVIYLPGAGWLIADALRTTGAHSVETIWNFGPTVDSDYASAHLRLVAARDRRGPVVAVNEDYVIGQTAPVAGWYSEQFGQKQAALTRHSVFRTHGRSHFIWAIPIDARAEVTAVKMTGRGVTIRFGTGEDARHVELRFTPAGTEVSTPSTHE